jgi:hypothetical protein
MYTDDQIAEALERCAFESPLLSCEKCPLFDDCADLEKIAAERIRFLNSEIEIQRQKWANDISAKQKSIFELQEQLDNLRTERFGIQAVNKAVPVTKSTERYIKIKAFDEFKRIFEKRCLDCGIYTEQVRKQFEQSLDEMGVFHK